MSINYSYNFINWSIIDGIIKFSCNGKIGLKCELGSSGAISHYRYIVGGIFRLELGINYVIYLGGGSYTVAAL